MDKSRETAMEYVKKFQELIDNFDSVTCAACDCMGRINGMNSNIRPESRPVRMELWGDEIDSIRMFDPESQRSLEEADVDSFLSVLDACHMLIR